MLKNIICGVLGVILIVGGFYLFRQSNDLPKDLSEWQAVFLTDGQVYFGHLVKHNKKFYLLENVYYLKYGSAIQQDKAPSAESSAPNLNLIELGGEIHGPENKMYISKDKLLFIENLKESSGVLTAIKKNI